MAQTYDVIVIGAGPAGYVAALRCAQLGMEVACVEQWINTQGNPALGGTCLNVGCIPSKTLLESSEQYQKLKQGLDTHGIQLGSVELDLQQMMQRKHEIVAQLTDGIAQLFKSNGIVWLQGRGKLLAAHQIEVTAHDGSTSLYSADHIILATGSSPVTIGAAPLDGERIVDSTGGQEFTEVPKTLGVIGAGVIGLELGSVWKRLGSEVILLEAVDQFLADVDEQIARDALRQFTRQGLDIRLGARVVKTEVGDEHIAVYYQDQNGDHTLTVDNLLVCVGRIPNSDGLAAPEAGLLFDERGYVHTDEYCQTNLPGVYAIGDLVRGPMLAHKGSEEGVMVAESIAGHSVNPLNHDAIPWVIYTHPEIAWVGKTEQILKTQGVPYNVGTFPFAANGRAKAMGESSGMVKILAHAETDAILGAHIIGPMASELIQECVLAMEFSASSEDLARTIHGHPTLYEAVHEAALAVHGMALHKVNT